MLIETERMIIRDFSLDDVNDLHEIFGDAETMQNCEPAFHFEKTKKFLEKFCITKKSAVAAVLKDSGKMIGYILFKPWEEAVYEMAGYLIKSIGDRDMHMRRVLK